ncbi:hypothetical protein [Rubripirellula obstinata]|nr:hypothetical protein [Rubripirellula obstinata]
MNDASCPLNMCWGTAAAVGINARTIGHRICWPPGDVARHGLAFLMTSLACSLAFVAINYRDGIDRLLRDLPDGLAAGALIGGIAVAAAVELAYHAWCASIRSFVTTNAKTHNGG